MRKSASNASSRPAIWRSHWRRWKALRQGRRPLARSRLACLPAIQPGDLLFFRGESTERITHVAFAADGDGLIHSTLPCGGMVAESWGAGTRAAPLRDRLVAVRRMETR